LQISLIMNWHRNRVGNTTSEIDIGAGFTGFTNRFQFCKWSAQFHWNDTETCFVFNEWIMPKVCLHVVGSCIFTRACHITIVCFVIGCCIFMTTRCVAIVCLVVGCCIFTKWSHCIASLFYFRLLHIHEGLSCRCSLFCCRLLHIHDGSSRRCRQIVQLLDITSVDQCQERSLTLKQRKALRITAKGICLGIYWLD